MGVVKLATFFVLVVGRSTRDGPIWRVPGSEIRSVGGACRGSRLVSETVPERRYLQTCGCRVYPQSLSPTAEDGGNSADQRLLLLARTDEWLLQILVF